MRIGGAFVGTYGTTGVNNDIANNLKKSALMFSREYTKSKPDQVKLMELLQEIYGYIQTLRLTDAINDHEAKTLIEELQDLMD